MASSVRWIMLTGLLLICVPRASHAQNDPCDPTVYELIDMHGGRREKDYVPQDTDQLHCDLDVDEATWMRFVRDGISYKLTNQLCVSIDHCGTQGPLWIESRSSHPTAVGAVGEKNVSICTNYGFAACCSVIGKSTVRLCRDNIGDEYYVYKLRKPPDCYTGYCVDPVTGSCAPNYKRDPNNNNCRSIYPPQTPPTLVGPPTGGTSANFYCQVAYVGTADMSTDARFDVTFLFDGIADPDTPVVTVTAGNRALLEETHLQGHFGKEISCGSKPYWQSDPDSKGSDARSSNSYFIGVWPDSNRITISEANGAPKSVVLRSTVPVVCKDPNRPCRACTTVATDGRATMEEQCEYCFEPGVQTSTLRLSPLRSPRVDPTSTYYIEFSPFVYKYDVNGGGTPDTTFTGYEMNDILVTQEDTEYAQCRAVSDPHITSFDGKYYHVYDIGQFLMWQSSAPRHFEVHVRFWRCNPTRNIPVSCVCAVTVREGNAILGVDRCGSRSLTSIARPKIKKYSPPGWDLPSGAYVSTDRVNNYYINMPSGAYVRAEAHPLWGLNIYLYALAEDQQRSSGLCGNFDGERQNDLTLKNTDDLDAANDQANPIPRDFSESYRIPQSQSFFDSTPQWLTVPDPELIKCRCNAGAIDCSPQADVEGTGSVPDGEVDPLQNHEKVTGNGGRRRRKREVDELSDKVDDEEDEDFDYGEGFTPKTTFEWPTDSGITEEQARGICEDTFDDLPYKDDCIAKTNIDIEDSVRQCIQDIQIMDDTTWARASLGTFETSCQFLVLQDPNMYTEGPDGKLEPPMQILGKMCPSNCNGHGTCVDGVCDCTIGFTGVDCALEEGVAPVLHYIPGTGRCDLTLRPCREFRLVASLFQKTDKLTCRVTELSSKASAGDSPVSHDPTVMTTSHGTAKFVTAAEIACKLPEIASQDLAYYQLRFDFSYDGETYSNQLDLTIFDGECLHCENDCGNPANWIMLDDSCLIDGRCVMAGDTHTESNCFICDPSQSISQWTQLPADQCSGVTLHTEPTPALQSTSTSGKTMLSSSTTGAGTPSHSTSSKAGISSSTTHAGPITAPHSTSSKAGLTTTQSSTSDEGPPIPIIAGVVGGVLLIVAVAAAVACYIKCRHGNSTSTQQQPAPNVYEKPMQPNVIYDKTGKVDILYDKLNSEGIYEDPPEPRPENDYQPHPGPHPEYADTAAPVKY